MNSISDEIMKSIEILIDSKIDKLKFDRTIDGKIIKVTTSGYEVGIEGQNININTSVSGYSVGDMVKVCFPQNNASKAFIVKN